MNIIDTLVLIPAAQFDTLWLQAHPEEEQEIPENIKVLNQGVRGFWKDHVDGRVVVNLLADKATLDQFMINHSLTTRYDWSQGNGYDSLDSGYPTIPAEVLALMEDYSANPPIPATFENPNFGCMFFGQKERIFAGDFSSDFSEDYR